MNEMVERVGRAVLKAIEHVSDLDDSMIEDIGRAAIAAMREPTEAMQIAGQKVNNLDEVTGHFEYLSREEMTDAWQAMIDETLK